jgi:hypothetical protein
LLDVESERDIARLSLVVVDRVGHICVSVEE